jgi:hypothetical protein
LASTRIGMLADVPSLHYIDKGKHLRHGRHYISAIHVHLGIPGDADQCSGAWRSPIPG